MYYVEGRQQDLVVLSFDRLAFQILQTFPYSNIISFEFDTNSVIQSGILTPIFFLNKFIYLIFLFLAALGLRCCARAFSICGERGLLFVAVCVLLIAVAPLVQHRLQARGLQQLWHAGSVVVDLGLQSAGSVVVAHGLSCSAACGIFPDQGSNPCLLCWQVDS